MSEKKKGDPIGCAWLLCFVVALVISVTLFTLRITEQITLSWWWVFSPVLLVVGVPTVILLVMALVAMTGKVFGEDDGAE